MDLTTFLIQCLNSVQYELLLFLVASGLTLIFGIMGVINLAHGSFYMIGAYLAFTLASLTGSFELSLLLGIVLAVVFGYLLEWCFFSFLYEREHLQQVLMTYGLILVFEELRSLLIDNDVHGVAVPGWLGGSIALGHDMTYPIYGLFVSGVCLVMAAAMPLMPAPLSTTYTLELGAQVLTMAIFALSLQLLVGFTGLVSLGHAAFYGAAAYAVTMFAPADGPGNGWWLPLASVSSAALLALIIGALVMRTQAVYFIMVTLAFAQLVYFVAHDSPWFGGSDGADQYFKPVFPLGQQARIDLDNPITLHEFTVGCTALAVALLMLVLRSRAGHALIGVKHNEQRMRAAGFHTTAYKLASFVLSGALAGMGAEESDRMLSLLRQLREDHAILLVEHDMEAVFAVADAITVMVNGSVIASGSPQAVRENRDVQAA